MMSITAAGLTIGRTYKVHSTTMISVSVASTEVVMRLRSGTTTGGGQVSADTSVFDGTGRKAKMFEHHFTASATTHSFNVTAARQAGTGTITHDPSSTAQSQMYVDYVSG